MVAWRIDAEEYLLDLAEWAIAGAATGTLTDADGVQRRVAELRNALDDGDGQPDWGGGTGIGREAAWLALHRLEISVLDRTTDRCRITEVARRHLSREASAAEATAWMRRIDATKDLDQVRAIAAEAVRLAHERSTARLRSTRSRRRVAVALAAFLGLLGGGLVAFQTRTTARLVATPQNVPLRPAAVLGLVLLLGLVGGALTSVLRVYSSPRWQTRDSRWCDPRPAQIAIRLAVAPWSALVSVWLVGGGAMTSAYPSLPALMLIALAGGFGQEGLTRRLDRLAEGGSGQRGGSTASSE